MELCPVPQASPGARTKTFVLVSPEPASLAALGELRPVPAVGNCTHALIAAYFKLRFSFLFGLVNFCSAAFMVLYSGLYLMVPAFFHTPAGKAAIACFVKKKLKL
jgi:hypothetical protein